MESRGWAAVVFGRGPGVKHALEPNHLLAVGTLPQGGSGALVIFVATVVVALVRTRTEALERRTVPRPLTAPYRPRCPIARLPALRARRAAHARPASSATSVAQHSTRAAAVIAARHWHRVRDSAANAVPELVSTFVPLRAGRAPRQLAERRMAPLGRSRICRGLWRRSCWSR